MDQKACVMAYIQSWLDQDCSNWDALFAEDVSYSECYGPCYQTLSSLKQWFQQWNQVGKVLAWDIYDFIEEEDKLCVSWYFHSLYEGREDAFDGVSILHFNKEGTIQSVAEYQSTLPHVKQE